LAQGVDVQRIQAYQIREFVEALYGVEAELRKAVGSGAPPAMRLALLGPVSPLAIARCVHDAVEKGRTPVAGAFQLVELSACLSRVKSAADDSAHGLTWRAFVGDALQQIQDILARVRERDPRAFGRRGAFRAYERAAAASGIAR
jgi:hypothetical protein